MTRKVNLSKLPWNKTNSQLSTVPKVQKMMAKRKLKRSFVIAAPDVHRNPFLALIITSIHSKSETGTQYQIKFSRPKSGYFSIPIWIFSTILQPFSVPILDCFLFIWGNFRYLEQFWTFGHNFDSVLTHFYVSFDADLTQFWPIFNSFSAQF